MILGTVSPPPYPLYRPNGQKEPMYVILNNYMYNIHKIVMVIVTVEIMLIMMIISIIMMMIMLIIMMMIIRVKGNSNNYNDDIRSRFTPSIPPISSQRT
jgi:hypothetical protein